jgi:NhaP-type Na+/H+ or K+/H+ antiporter
MDTVLFTLISIVVLGVLAQWIAWRLRLPSILLLLSIGILAGPVFGILDPDLLLGDLLLPVVSLSVAIILYEGGLSLRFRELREVGSMVRNLCTVGVAVTWMGATASVHLVFGVPWSFALLVGALFIVTGPTVVGPMLRQIRPSGGVGPILKWEGIVTDPLGVMIAILVFESLIHHGGGSGTARGIALTVGLGSVAGVVAAGVFVVLLRRHLIPDHLQSPASLMLLFLVFGACEAAQPESGLFAVTVMGLALANQRRVDIRHVIEFKESLQLLLLAAVFIILAARIERELVAEISWRHFLFLGLLMLVVRPLAVLVSALGTKVPWNERLFLLFVAPRGIVSAALASILALQLTERGFEHARLLIPLTFFVIISTVVIYGLVAPWAARRLGLASTASRGVLMLGAHDWARDMAAALRKAGADVLLVDSNRRHVTNARIGGLEARVANALVEGELEELDLSGKGTFLALTSNDEVNALACERMAEIFGRSAIFQLVTDSEADKGEELDAGGRRLFGSAVSYKLISRRVREGWSFKVTPLSEEFTLDDYRERYGDEALPLFVIGHAGDIRVVTAELATRPRQDERLVGLVCADAQQRPPQV